MGTWSLKDIPWDTFDKTKVDPKLLSLVKAACMVEYNSADYNRYLSEVFYDDLDFQQASLYWSEEEIQHGEALRKWAELADPDFDFGKSFKMFSEGYKLPANVEKSVRGSRTGELIARCIVETGTSWYYGAIRDYTDEPVLKAICNKISADELRHYKLFYNYLNQYLEKEKISFIKRICIVLGRIRESEDDELAYAYFAAHANDNTLPYNRKYYTDLYFGHAKSVYQRTHVERMTAMVFKTIGLKPHTFLNRMVNYVAWKTLKRQAA
jgi:rubrerythrin